MTYVNASVSKHTNVVSLRYLPNMLLGPNLQVEIHKAAICKLFAEISEMYMSMEKQFAEQDKIHPKLKELSLRYHKIRDFNQNLPDFQIDIVQHVKSKIISEWHSLHRKAWNGINNLEVQLEDLELSYAKFDKSLLDNSFAPLSDLETVYEIWKPLNSYVENLHDLLTYFQVFISTILTFMEMVQIEDIESIENYFMSIKISENFKTFYRSCADQFALFAKFEQMSRKTM